MKRKKIKLDVFANWEITFHLGTIEETEKEFKRIGAQDNFGSGSFAGKCLVKKNITKIFVVTGKKEGKKYSLVKQISTLTHEIMHAVDKLCSRLKIDDTETRAYISGYLMEKFLPVIIEGEK